MDIATIVGLLAAFGLIISAMSDPAAFVDIPSVLLVVAGSIAVVLFRSSLGEFLGAIGVMGKCFKNKLEPGEDLIIQITELANIARKDGMIALEGQEIANPFLAKAIGMLVDGTEADMIRKSLEQDTFSIKRLQSNNCSTWKNWNTDRTFCCLEFKLFI